MSMTNADRPVRSGLVIDVSDLRVRTALLHLVDGEHRFIGAATAHSTSFPPIQDIAVGVKRSIRSVEEDTGLRVLGTDGIELPMVNDRGVDLAVVTGQPAPPLRLSIVCLGRRDAADAVIAAARRTWTVADIVLERVRTPEGAFSGALLATTIQEFKPDVVTIVQGDCSDAEWAAAVGTLTQLINSGLLTSVIVIAPERLLDGLQDLNTAGVEVQGLDPSSASQAEISSSLELEFLARQSASVDVRALVGGTGATYVSQVRAAELATRYIARRRECPVAAVDIDSGTTVHWATPDMSEVLVRADIDVSGNVAQILRGNPSAILGRLPFPASQEDVVHWVLNRMLRPRTVTENPRDLAIEMALAVEAVRMMTVGAREHLALSACIIGGSPFIDWPNAALASLALLDALEPEPVSGVVEIVLDTDGLVTAAGAVGESSPAMAAAILDNDLLAPTATAIVISGKGGEGVVAVRGSLDVPGRQTVRFSVASGGMHRFEHLADGATISLTCESGFTIGDATTRQFTIDRANAAHSNVSNRIDPGDVGVIIDARPRPLPSTGDIASRYQQIATWQDALGIQR